MGPWGRFALTIVLVLAVLFALGFIGSGVGLMMIGLSVGGIESMGIGVMLIIGGIGLFLLFAHFLAGIVKGRK